MRWLPRIRFEEHKHSDHGNPAGTQQAGNLAPSYGTSMSSPHREEPNVGLFENWRRAGMESFRDLSLHSRIVSGSMSTGVDGDGHSVH